MKLLTTAFYLLLLVLLSPWLVYRSIRYGRYRRGWMAKLFGISAETPRKTGKTVWIHAVSVGEVQLMRPLIKKLTETRPDMPLLISVTTDSGYQLANDLFRDHSIIFAPFDLPWAIRNVFRRFNPCLVILMELEVWPNWLRIAEELNCPVVVVNGRLSANSFRGYRRIAWLMKGCMGTLDWVGAQSQQYADRFVQLGTSPSATCVTGNIKFDGADGKKDAPEVVARSSQLAIHPEDRVWVAGSTQAPEEKLVLQTFLRLVKNHPKLRLVLVPRHPERFGEVASLIEQTGLPWLRRSNLSDQATPGSWKIFLGDSVGELRWWWGLADVAFVGGSFGDRGGQNMIEPAAYGVPTCFGPNTKNFADIVALLLEAHAASQLQDPQELETWVDRILRETTKAEQMGQNAAKVAASHRGAIQRTWEGIEKFLPAS